MSGPIEVAGKVAPSKRRSWKKIKFHKLLPRLKLARKSSRVSPIEESKKTREQKRDWGKTMSEELTLADSVDYMETDLISPSRNGE